MSQYEFDQLLQKYLTGACDPAEEKLILNWYQDMTTQRPEPVDAQEKARIRQRVWQKLAMNTTQKNSPQRPAQRRPAVRYGTAIAAGVLLVITLGWWSHRTVITPATATQVTPAPGGIEQQNNSPVPQPIRLEDGSLITLKPGGSLSYPAHFGRQNRVVSLKGEAFFQVSKDPARPFIVHTGALVTEVLGTSFSISANAGAKAIEVSVVTGRVSVYQAVDRSNRRSREVILKPNERLTYTTHSQQLIPALVDQPVQVAPPAQAQQLLFDGTPLPAVLTRLQTMYGIDIYLESDGLKACVLNADLNDLSMYEQLDLLCRSVDAQYEVRGTSIFIKGSGCR